MEAANGEMRRLKRCSWVHAALRYIKLPGFEISDMSNLSAMHARDACGHLVSGDVMTLHLELSPRRTSRFGSRNTKKRQV
jgi:hypothetical protein